MEGVVKVPIKAIADLFSDIVEIEAVSDENSA